MAQGYKGWEKWLQKSLQTIYHIGLILENQLSYTMLKAKKAKNKTTFFNIHRKVEKAYNKIQCLFKIETKLGKEVS